LAEVTIHRPTLNRIVLYAAVTLSLPSAEALLHLLLQLIRPRLTKVYNRKVEGLTTFCISMWLV